MPQNLVPRYLLEDEGSAIFLNKPMYGKREVDLAVVLTTTTALKILAQTKQTVIFIVDSGKKEEFAKAMTLAILCPTRIRTVSGPEDFLLEEINDFCQK